MKRRAVIDKGIGETRAAVFEGRRCVELYVRRETDKHRPRLGDLFYGRVRTLEKSLGAAFVDLGAEPDGFLKFTTAPGAPRFTEGMRIEVEITREGEDGKGPQLGFKATAAGSTPGRLSGQSFEDFITKRYPGITIDHARVNTLIEAIEPEIAIPDGGSITIERTRALTAIDIDSGTAVSPFSVAKAACPVIAQQLRLRGIGGLICVDFPNLRQKRQREDLMKAFEAAFADDPAMVKIAPLSRFGVIEMTRSRAGRSVDDILTERSGALTLETEALDNLRQVEVEALANPGARLSIIVREPVMAWLQVGHIDWEAALSERIGARFTVKPGASFSVTGDR